MWHTKSADEILKELHSSEEGIRHQDIESRKAQYGVNALPEPKRSSMLSIFLKQFKSPIIYVLLISTLIVVAMGDFEDGLFIAVVLIINAIIGTIQEGKAENTLAALRNLVTTDAVVLRDGVEGIVPDAEVVPGDILILREGDKISADARVIYSADLNVDESSLTGESESVRKHTEILADATLPPADQLNMVFKGTYVIGGEARAIVVATGVNTVIGKISTKLGAIETDVPLKKHIDKLSRQIIIGVLFICVFIFIAGILRGFEAREMFASVVAMCVSAIPEGLPVVVTVILATGVHRMSKRNALVKRLQAVEALGQANIVAVDKTGTITLNQMMVSEVFTGNKIYGVSGSGYAPGGTITNDGNTIEPLDNPDLLLIGRLAGLCANALIVYSEDTKEWKRHTGDPTEAALMVFSGKVGFHKSALEQEYKKVSEIPFTSNLKYHVVSHEHNGNIQHAITGAPEVLIDHCSEIVINGKRVDLTVGHKEVINEAMDTFLQKGLRVIAIAVKQDKNQTLADGGIQDLSFVGLVGISDTIRSEIYEVVQEARSVGVRTIMITGDHAETAKSIAEKAGIYKEGDMVLTAQDLKRISVSEISKILPKISVFARVTPEEKLLIIEAYRRNGNIISMTGDGVNDAMSLAAADLGVAMGKTGTEVAKEAADIVLLDDNFSSIIAAIDEGRHIHNTIKKVILYLFATSIGEIFVIAIAIIAGYPLPLSPSQIIWLNFVTDGFLVIAIALEPKESKALLAPIKGKNLIDKPMIWRMAIITAVMSASTLILFDIYARAQGIAVATTVALTTLAILHWFNTWNVRSDTATVFSKTAFSNRYLNISIFIVIIAQLFAVYNPFFQKVLDTVPLDLKTWGIIMLASIPVVLAEEIRKFFARKRKKKV